MQPHVGEAGEDADRQDISRNPGNTGAPVRRLEELASGKGTNFRDGGVWVDKGDSLEQGDAGGTPQPGALKKRNTSDDPLAVPLELRLFPRTALGIANLPVLRGTATTLVGGQEFPDPVLPDDLILPRETEA